MLLCCSENTGARNLVICLLLESSLFKFIREVAVISKPICFYVHFCAMFFFFFPWAYWNITRTHRKSENFNCMVAQLILTLPHIQEFLFPVNCINKYTKNSLNYDHDQGKQGFHLVMSCHSTSVKRFKLQVFQLNGSTWCWNNQATLSHLSYGNNYVVYKNSLIRQVRRISLYKPSFLFCFVF